MFFNECPFNFILSYPNFNVNQYYITITIQICVNFLSAYVKIKFSEWMQFAMITLKENFCLVNVELVRNGK